MAKKTATLIVFFSLAIFCRAQLLWKITGSETEKPSYMFGTHHCAPLSIIDSIPAFEKAFASASCVYGEIDMVSADMSSMQNKILEKIYLPADSSWQVLFSAKQLQEVDSVLREKWGMSVSMFERIAPAFVMSQIEMMSAQRMFPGFDMSKQLDTELQKNAVAQGKTVKGLETFDYQLETIFGTSYRSQADEMLSDLLDGDFESEMREMSEAYMNQNLKVLTDALDPKDDPVKISSVERLVNIRNRNWVEKLRKELKTGGLFLVVGAGHLVGDNGLIKLLENNGFEVTPQ